MVIIKVKLPYVRDHVTRHAPVEGWVASKGNMYPGISTKLWGRRDHPAVVKFSSLKRAKCWARRNIRDWRAEIKFYATIPESNNIECLWTTQAR